jgi:hypothetical protein
MEKPYDSVVANVIVLSADRELQVPRRFGGGKGRADRRGQRRGPQPGQGGPTGFYLTTKRFRLMFSIFLFLFLPDLQSR